MAKKDSKKSGKRDKAAAGAAEAADPLRAAVERTFSASAEGAKSTRGRAKDVTAAANRIREVLEDRVLEELKGLRSDVEGLAKRVAALEVGPLGGSSKPARSTTAKKSTSTARKRAAKRSTAARKGASSTARKRSSSTARKSSSSGSSGSGSSGS